MSVIQFQPATVTEPDIFAEAEKRFEAIGTGLGEAMSDLCAMRRALKAGDKRTLLTKAGTLARLAGMAAIKANEIAKAEHPESER